VGFRSAVDNNRPPNSHNTFPHFLHRLNCLPIKCIVVILSNYYGIQKKLPFYKSAIQYKFSGFELLFQHLMELSSKNHKGRQRGSNSIQLCQLLELVVWWKSNNVSMAGISRAKDLVDTKVVITLFYQRAHSF